jgi:hypothetical protein
MYLNAIDRANNFDQLDQLKQLFLEKMLHRLSTDEVRSLLCTQVHTLTHTHTHIC